MRGMASLLYCNELCCPAEHSPLAHLDSKRMSSAMQVFGKAQKDLGGAEAPILLLSRSIIVSVSENRDET